MQNWEIRLKEKLKNRQMRNRTLENFLVVQNEIIRPTFEKIKKLLYEYYINSNLGLNDSSFVVEATDSSFLLMKLEFEVMGDNEILVRTSFFSLDPRGENGIINIDEKTIFLNEITSDSIGDIFASGFEKTKFFSN